MVRLERSEARAALDAIRRHRLLALDELLMYILAGRVTNPVEGHIEQLRRAVAADPADGKSAAALVRYLLYHSDIAESGTLVDRFLDRFPTDVDLLASKVEVLLNQHQLPVAAKLLATQSRREGRSARLQFIRGAVASEAGDWPRAIQFLRQSLELDADDPQACYKLANALLALGYKDRAQPLLERFRRLQALPLWLYDVQASNETSDRANKLAEVGQLLLALDRREEAAFCFQLIRTMAPDHPAAQHGLLPAQVERKPAIDLFADWPSIAARRLPTRSPVSGPIEDHGEHPSAPIQLTDCHQEAGIDFQYFNGHSRERFIVETLGGGVAAFDFDNDDWPDLFFVQGCPLPRGSPSALTNQLYRNLGGARFQAVTDAARLHQNDYSVGCAAGDVDNDGFLDLAVTSLGRTALYRNNGDGTFTESARAAGLSADGVQTTALFADFDRDGNLDLVVLRYVADMKVCRGRDGQPVICHPRDLDAAQSILYANHGDGTFRDISTKAGFVVPNGKSLGAIAADFDDDGWPDLYVSNDTTPNFLFHNLGRGPGATAGIQFAEQGMSSGTALTGDGNATAGMGIACADFDGNGRLDVFVTNFFAETFTLYLNQGQLFFADATKTAHLAEPTRSMLGFGTQAIDFDLDGQPDLFVANGHIFDHRDRGEPYTMRPQAFHNTDGVFTETAFPANTYGSGKYLGRGLTAVDWNRDGAMDLVVTHLDRPAALLRNDTPRRNHFAVADLVGVHANRDGVNTRLVVRAGNRQQVIERFAGGYLGSNENRLVIGLGAATTIDSVAIRWPSGLQSTWKGLPADRRYLLVEGRAPLDAGLR